MRLTVVGCSGSTAGPASAASCYLVEHGGYRLVVDLGSGSLGPLQRFVDPGLVDAVLISHLHVDHFADLCALYVWRKYGMAGAGVPLPVLGPSGTAERLVAASGPLGSDHGRPVFQFTSMDAGPVTAGPFTVTPARAAHPGEAYAYRIEAAGRTLVYTGDTGPSTDVERLATGADLLLAEASFVSGEDNPKDLHLTGRETGLLATVGKVGALVVTHVPPWQAVDVVLDEVRSAWDGPMALAAPGDVHEVGTVRPPG